MQELYEGGPDAVSGRASFDPDVHAVGGNGDVAPEFFRQAGTGKFGGLSGRRGMEE